EQALTAQCTGKHTRRESNGVSDRAPVLLISEHKGFGLWLCVRDLPVFCKMRIQRRLQWSESMKVVDRDGSSVGQRSQSAGTMDGHCVRNLTPAAGVDLALKQVV